MPDLSFLTLPLSYVVPLLAVISIIVFVHEYGHFKVARLCGVKVDTFSIGFGRAIFARNDRYGTEWRIAWIPLGGYVKFAGDTNAASMPDGQQEKEPEPGDFHAASVWRRIAIVAAGPMANFIFAIAVFAVVYMAYGHPVSSTVIGSVIEGSAAEEAGLKPGDRIVAVNGVQMKSFGDISNRVAGQAGSSLRLEVERNGETLAINAIPRRVEIDGQLGGKIEVGRLGITSEQNLRPRFERQDPISAISLGAGQTWFIISNTLSYVGKIIVGEEKANQLTGPIGIAQVTKEAASISILSVVQLIAFLSVSIGLINLFPIPVLDGGHLVYYFIEIVRGKPLGQQAQETGFKVGLALILTLTIAVFWNDLERIFTS